MKIEETPKTEFCKFGFPSKTCAFKILKISYWFKCYSLDISLRDEAKKTDINNLIVRRSIVLRNNNGAGPIYDWQKY